MLGDRPKRKSGSLPSVLAKSSEKGASSSLLAVTAEPLMSLARKKKKKKKKKITEIDKMDDSVPVRMKNDAVVRSHCRGRGQVL